AASTVNPWIRMLRTNPRKVARSEITGDVTVEERFTTAVDATRNNASAATLARKTERSAIGSGMSVSKSRRSGKSVSHSCTVTAPITTIENEKKKQRSNHSVGLAASAGYASNAK